MPGIERSEPPGFANQAYVADVLGQTAPVFIAQNGMHNRGSYSAAQRGSRPTRASSRLFRGSVLSMTVLNTGSTKAFAAGWESIFSGKKNGRPAQQTGQQGQKARG